MKQKKTRYGKERLTHTEVVARLKAYETNATTLDLVYRERDQAVKELRSAKEQLRAREDNAKVRLMEQAAHFMEGVSKLFMSINGQL